MNTQAISIVLDTASDMLACGLAQITFKEDLKTPVAYDVIATADHLCRRHANVELTSTIDELLVQNELSNEDISAVLVGRGPGSFTGVRIGIATAKGLAAGRNCPLYGSSTLDAVAFNAWKAGYRGRIGVVADAMRKELYPGLYTLSDEGIARQFVAEEVIKAKDLVELWKSFSYQDTTLLIGDGLVKYRDLFEEAGFSQIADENLWYPSSEGLLYSFVHMAQTVQNGDPALVLPVYTRLSDAEEDERKRLGLTDAKHLTGVADELADIHLQLRPMSINDAKQVAELECEIYADSYRDPTPESRVISDIQNPSQYWWVAHDRGRIVGFAGGAKSGETFEIYDVCVSPARRREGIATKLLLRLAYDAHVMNALEMELEVMGENKSALNLYKKLGFKQVGIRKGYYNNGIDGIVMKAPLPLGSIQDQKTQPEPHASLRPWSYVNFERTPDEQAKIYAQGELIFAIESSCDETAMAIVNAKGTIIASVIATQIDFHARFGGVVPEIASRKHTEALLGVYEETLEQAAKTLGVSSLTVDDLSCIAVTEGPGLVGALVVGVAFAKGLALAADLPLIGVNHLEGHLFANLFETPDLKPPFVASLISGGNTMLVHVKDWGDYHILGATIDDAVGEAFDKVAKALGLGYPGGPVISKLAADGDPNAIHFPRAMMHSHDYRFSLSGLKTSVITYINNENQAGRPINVNDLAASFEAAVIEVQAKKARDAVRETGVKDFCAGGGVTANKALREAYHSYLEPEGVRVTVPPFGVCTDNAAMIALVALQKFKRKEFSEMTMDADPNLALSCKSE